MIDLLIPLTFRPVTAVCVQNRLPDFWQFEFDTEVAAPTTDIIMHRDNEIPIKSADGRVTGISNRCFLRNQVCTLDKSLLMEEHGEIYLRIYVQVKL